MSSKNPIMTIDFKDAFVQLTEKEKNYAYYISEACWAGCPIVLFQVSFESPGLFIIFQKFFDTMKPISEIKKKITDALKDEVSSEEAENFLLYVAKFYSNFGNYDSFGKKKFVPEIPVEKFEKILSLSSRYSEIEPIWKKIKEVTYDKSDSFSTINLEEKGGKNYYYMGGIKEKEIEEVDKVLNDKGISPLNTRLRKTEEGKKLVYIGSIDKKEEKLPEGNITLVYGEFSKLLEKLNENLVKAKEYCANDTQKKMIDHYIESFKTGSIEAHKDSQREWVRDKLPNVESNLGWIETYIDPFGVRGYYEGWVAIADKKQSEQFGTLVSNAEEMLKTYPWSSDFEKDKFCKPDFVALDVVCFATIGCPVGINIPNYSDVQEEVGFKNISLSNAFPSFNSANMRWIDEKDVELLTRLGKASYVVKVAGHELLGHGSGKLLRKNKDGTFNFDINKVVNPLTGGKIEKYYVGEETFEQKFTAVGRSMEECRADLAGLFFGYNKKVQSIFGIDEKDYEDIIYCMFLLHARKGILGLPLYNVNNKKWGQAHTQDAFVIASFVLENQKEGKEILTVDVDEEKKTFSVKVNKGNLIAYGKEIITDILKKLHIWKCIGDVESAKEFYEKHSEVKGKFLKIREIIIENETPRRLVLYHNLKKETNDVSITEYPSSFEGIIQSFNERYPQDYNNMIYEDWMK